MPWVCRRCGVVNVNIIERSMHIITKTYSSDDYHLRHVIEVEDDDGDSETSGEECADCGLPVQWEDVEEETEDEEEISEEPTDYPNTNRVSTPPMPPPPPIVGNRVHLGGPTTISSDSPFFAPPMVTGIIKPTEEPTSKVEIKNAYDKGK